MEDIENFNIVEEVEITEEETVEEEIGKILFPIF
jgi:hypothetical protein